MLENEKNHPDCYDDICLLLCLLSFLFLANVNFKEFSNGGRFWGRGGLKSAVLCVLYVLSLLSLSSCHCRLVVQRGGG